MSHYAVATMKKMKAENLSGMLRHDFRETKNHKNKDIDPNKSDQNIELVADHKLHKQDIVDYINKCRRSSRKLRRDAVMVDEWIISSDREFFDTGHSERNEGYFKSALAYFQQKFGSENVMYASVHYDETTPHMHMGIVPMTKDGKLSSKQVFDRNTLRTIQTEFPRYMQEQGYEVVRGSENSQRKKLSVNEYKHVQDTIKQNRQHETKLKEQGLKTIAEINPEVTAKDEKGERVKLSEHAELIPKLAKQFDIEYVFQSLRKVIEMVRQQLKRRFERLKQKEQELSEREKTIAAKEKAFAEFEKNFELPSPSAQPQFYRMQVEEGIIKPAEKLAEHLERSNDKFSHAQLKMPEKGRERK